MGRCPIPRSRGFPAAPRTYPSVHKQTDFIPFPPPAQAPPFSPPAIVFPIVWAILYLLMGIGAARIAMAPPSDARSRSLTLYLVQLFFNFLWPFVFFNLQWYGVAFLWLIALWLLVFFMIQSFRTVDPTAAALQLPYLIWLTFAAYLNLGVWLLNR